MAALYWSPFRESFSILESWCIQSHSVVSFDEMSNVALRRKQRQHMAALSPNQEAPARLREACVPAKASHCVWVLFISHMEKGRFRTGSNLTHSNTMLMQPGEQLVRFKSVVTRVARYAVYIVHWSFCLFVFYIGHDVIQDESRALFVSCTRTYSCLQMKIQI